MNLVKYEKQFAPEKDFYDVVVIGGGSAGICASIAASRNGMKTLLIENTGWLGGIGTTGAMVEFGPIVRGGLRVLGGIPYELMQRMKKFGGAELRNETEDMCFAAETFAHTAMLMCEEAGVELLLHARFIDSVIENRKIKGVIVDTKEKTMMICAKTFIDCSGDGDVFFKAGIPYELGRACDNNMQPMTLVFFVNNVNYKKFQDEVDKESNGDPDPYFVKLVAKAKADGKFTIPITRPGSTGPVPRFGRPYDLSCCEVFVNGTNIVGKCGVNAKDLTQAELTTRKQVYVMYDFLKAYVPGFEECYISHVPTEIGVRETRRLRGCYMLTKEDLLTQRKFEDRIAIGFNMIDIHQVAGEDFDLTHFADGEYYTIPYRSLICDGLENLIVAGRCISATHEALGAVRVMVNTMPIAEAAGTAAAIAVKSDKAFSQIDINLLQTTLRKANAILEIETGGTI